MIFDIYNAYRVIYVYLNSENRSQVPAFRDFRRGIDIEKD